MFCGNCGSRLPDGALFCANCGTKLEAAPAPVEETPAPAVETPAPVAETPAPVAETPAPAPAAEAPAPAPAAETPAPVAETPAPAAEAPAPAAETPAPAPAAETPAPAPVAETPAPAAEAPAPAPAAETPAPAAETPAPAPVAETPAPAPAAETPAPVQVQQPAQPVYQQPVQTAAPMQAAPMQPAFDQAVAKKKKGKAGLVIGLSAAAVVIGGAAVGYFGFHSDITRLIMGDAEYAKKLETDSYSEIFTAENCDMIDSYLTDSLSSVGEVKYLADYSENNNDLSEEERNNNAMAEMSKLIREAMNSAAEELSNVEGVSVDTTIGMKLGDELETILGDDFKLPDMISFRTETAGGDAAMAGFHLLEGSDAIGGIRLFLDEKNIAVTLPKISEKTIAFPIKASAAAPEKTKMTPPDTAELTRIRNELARIYLDAVGRADTEYSTGKLECDDYVYGECKTAVIRIDGENIRDTVNEMSEFLKYDTYLRDYLLDSGITSEEYDKLFEKQEKDANAEIIITNYYDVHNRILGKKITVNGENKSSDGKKTENLLEFIHFVDKNGVELFDLKVDDDTSTSALDFAATAAISADSEGVKTFEISADTDASKPGREFKAVITQTGDDQNGSCNIRTEVPVNEKNTVVSVNVDYSDIAETEFLGQKVTTGSVKVYFAEDNKFSFKDIIESAGANTPDMGDMMSYSQNIDNEKMIGMISRALDKLNVSFTTSIEGDSYVTSVSLALGSLVSLDTKASIKPISEKAKMPDLGSAIVVDNVDERAAGELGLDLLKWAKSVQGRSAVVDTVIQSLTTSGLNIDEIIAAGEEKLRYYENYGGYNASSEYFAADAAQNLYDSVSMRLSELAANDASASGMATVYYDKNGSREILSAGPFHKTALENALSDFEQMYTPMAVDNDEDIGKHNISSLYAEINYDSSYVNNLGVTVVYTDDKAKLPSKRPTMLDFAGGSFEASDEPFVMGAYPYLSSDTSYSGTDYSDFDSEVKKLDEYAAAAATAASSVTIRHSGRFMVGQFDQAMLELINDSGEWHPVAARAGFDMNTSLMELEASYVFEDDFMDDIKESLNESAVLSRADYSRIQIVFYDGQLVGAEAMPSDSSYTYNDGNMPSAKDFADNSYKNWGGKSYLVDDVSTGYFMPMYGYEAVPFGTYSIKANGPLPAAVKPVFNLDGDWYVSRINGLDVSLMYAISGVTDEIGDLALTVSGDTIYVDGEEYPIKENGGSFYVEIDGVDNELVIDAQYGTIDITDAESGITVTFSQTKPDIHTLDNVTFDDMVGTWRFRSITPGYTDAFLDEEDMQALNSNFTITVNSDGTAYSTADGIGEQKYTTAFEEKVLLLTADDSRLPALMMIYSPADDVLVDITTMITFERG